ncbi:hypothetical protein HPB47_005421 [Ixodes persulcatus]|uniref:Uncharacterized protein n=1 Tax=Ixodes persulcatus TaxID=34615 RepID=A0AC60PD48_IXOPE|nr:hypothetical protein HPB47_005421 [Ixodes persulcatus]
MFQERTYANIPYKVALLHSTRGSSMAAFLVSLVFLASRQANAVCIVPEEQFAELRNASEDVRKIIAFFTSGNEKALEEEDGRVLRDSAYGHFGTTNKLVLTFAARFKSRTNVFQEPLAKPADQSTCLRDVHTEDVLAVRWKRQREVARLVKPESRRLKILGLGGSVGTPPGGVTAALSVVRSFDNLQAVSGRIVLYLPEWKGSTNYASYLLRGTSQAARQGALACLFRAPEPLTGTALYAGLTGYDKGTPRIAAAVLTKQDADLLARMAKRGEEVQVYLKLEPGDPEQVVSRNIVADWIGTKYPKEYIMVGAHVDSWDIGQGAVDNAAAIFVIWRALSALKKLQLRPKRTVRFVVWTAQEQGGVGATEFYRRHAADSWERLVTAWYYHEDMRHTEADTVSGINAADMDLCAAMVAGLLHMVGQMERKLPR